MNVPNRSPLQRSVGRIDQEKFVLAMLEYLLKTDFDKLLLQESPDAVIATNTEGEILYWSKGAEAILGYSSAEAVGRLIYEIIVPPEKVDEERRILAEALEIGFSIHESVRRRKDGSPVYVDTTTKVVRDANGDVDFLLSTEKDVTRLKAMRDAKLVEARFRDLLESMPDGIVMVNLAGRIVFSNTEAQTLFGYAAGELLGESIETEVAPVV